MRGYYITFYDDKKCKGEPNYIYSGKHETIDSAINLACFRYTHLYKLFIYTGVPKKLFCRVESDGVFMQHQKINVRYIIRIN